MAVHTEQTYRRCQETAAQLETALTALLAYHQAAPHDAAEQERVVRVRTTLRKELTRPHARVQRERIEGRLNEPYEHGTSSRLNTSS